MNRTPQNRRSEACSRSSLCCPAGIESPDPLGRFFSQNRQNRDYRVCQEGHALESWPAKTVQLVERGDMASERDAGLDRVIAFSDGVVAIAITLLILPLTEIEPGEGATLGNVAADNAGALLGFA